MTTSQIQIDSYRREPRRQFTRQFKAQVVEQLLADPAPTVAQVAREHALHPNQLCRWRREYVAGALATGRISEHRSAESTIELLPVSLVSERTPPARAGTLGTHSRVKTTDCVALRITVTKGTIEITNSCEPTLLHAVLQVLR